MLTHVLLELGPDETTMVATDRYRLSVRALRSYGFSGLPRRLLVPAADLSELARRAAWEHRVEIDADAEQVTLMRGTQRRDITTAELDFPTYQSLVDGAGPPTTRTIVDRVRLLHWVVEQTPHPIRLAVCADRVEMSRIGRAAHVRFDAVGSGPPLRTGFSPSVLGAALAASVGPDVLLEFVDPILPVVVRSADQGTFTTLAMPILLEPEDRYP